MPDLFRTPESWIDNRLRILVLGAGGTGGEVIYALARIHRLLLALNDPKGIHVTLMDGDLVSSANIGRQRFATCDIDYYKSDVLIQRINLFFGLDWRSISCHWTPQMMEDELRWSAFDLLISCVDSAKVRIALAHAAAPTASDLLWMDFGNGAHTGQCILGHLSPRGPSRGRRLPNVYDLHADQLALIEDVSTPSCSAAEAVRQQDLFVNPILAEAGISIIWKLLRHGGTESHGVLVDVREPSVEPIWIDEDAWADYYGYRGTPQSKTARRSPRARAPAQGDNAHP